MPEPPRRIQENEIKLEDRGKSLKQHEQLKVERVRKKEAIGTL